MAKHGKGSAADDLLERLHKIDDGLAAIRSLSKSAEVNGDVPGFVVDGLDRYMDGIFDVLESVVAEDGREK